jgi:hypothetical protein
MSIFAALSLSDNWLLWVTLAVLLVLVSLVGQKASADGVELTPDYVRYRKPMLAFEFNAGAAREMFENWEQSKVKLRLALLWDYLFIFIYPAAIATACFIAARFLDSHGILAFKYGLVIMCAQLVAAGLDAVENFALLRVLREPPKSSWPQIARWCALGKFGLILVGVVYGLFLGGGARLITLLTRSR